MSVLVLAEHDNATLKDATLAVVTAAGQLGGDVHVLVAGYHAQAAADAAAKVAGVAKVLLADDAVFEHMLAENVAPLIVGLMANYDAVLAPATTRGKNILPRVAAALDVAQISEILSIEAPDTFTRPIYAGNAIATVKSSDAKKVITVRGTAFAKAATTGASASVETIGGGAESGLSVFGSAELTASARPELTAAKIIVSGGRALGSSEKFHEIMEPLADKLGAGLGASRAAVDAGYVPNDYQVRPDRQDCRSRTLRRGRHLGRDPASRGHEGRQDHRRDQQRRGRADLPGCGLRPRRRPVQARPRADRKTLRWSNPPMPRS